MTIEERSAELDRLAAWVKREGLTASAACAPYAVATLAKLALPVDDDIKAEFAAAIQEAFQDGIMFGVRLAE